MPSPVKPPVFPKGLAALFALAILLVLLGGYTFLRGQALQARAAAGNQLTAIATLKTAMIATWRNERLTDASAFSGSPFFTATVAAWLKDPRPEVSTNILSRFQALQPYQQYREIALLDAAGQIRLSLSGTTGPADVAAQAALADAFRGGKPVFSDLHFAENGTGDNHSTRAISLDVIAPLLGQPGEPPLGAVMLSIDPAQELYPLLNTWPVPSVSAEALLVRRDGNDVVWLNNLRYQPNAALTLRRPLTDRNVPAVMAVLGQQGVVEGLDYRGVPVFSALAPVPGSPWFLVAKEDTAEVLASLPLTTGLIVAFMLGLLAGLTGLTWSVWQQAQKRFYRAAYTAEQARLQAEQHVQEQNDLLQAQNEELRAQQEELRQTAVDLRDSEARYRQLFEHMQTGLAVHELICNPQGQPIDYRFLSVNPRFEELTGLPASAVLGRTAREVLPGLEAGWLERYGRVALSGEPITFESHSGDLGRDYEVHAYCPAPGQFATLIQDITTRKRMEATLRVSEEKYRVLFEAFPVGITLTDGQGAIVETNRQAERLVGVPKAEHERRSYHSPEWRLIRPDGTPLPAEDYTIAQVLREKRLIENQEIGLVKDDGAITWLSVTGAPIPLENYGVALAYNDITERKRLEAELANTRVLLEEAFEQSPIPMVLVSMPDATFRIVNRANQEFLGLQAEPPIAGLALAGFKPSFQDYDAQGRLGSAKDLPLARALGGQHVVNEERRIVRKDGTTRWGLVSTAPIYNPQGALIAGYLVMHDITDRKQAERQVQEQNVLLQAQNEELTAQREELQSQNEALRTQQEELQRTEADLRESETRFRLALKNAPVSVAAQDPDLHFVWAYNQRTVRPSDVIGKTDADVFPPETAAQLTALKRQVLEAGTDRREQLWLNSGGRRLYLDLYLEPLRNAAGRVTGLGIATVDLTQMKLAEEALRESEFFFKESQRAAFIGSYKTDFVAGFWESSEVLDQIFGIDQHYVRSVPGWLDLIHPDDHAMMNRYLQDDVIANHHPFNKEYRIVRQSDGAVRWVNGLGQVNFDAAGNILSMIGTIQDITDRKQAELLIQAQQEQLVAQNEELAAQNEELATQARTLEQAETEVRQLNRELEARIQARSAQLSAANADLQLANAALLRAGRLKDEFLANMSHELRTPLTGILGLAEVMAKGIYGELSQKQRQALQMMQGSGEHLLQLINDILDLSKIEAGKVELQITPIGVQDLCQASLDFIKQIAYKKNLKLSFQTDAQVRLVQADERRLKQMLVNLLSNAVKFTPDGGRVGFVVAGDPTRQQVQFTVWDTGIGIAPEQQPLLFQPFTQIDGSLARKYEGTGLGLALVQAMAELHGGRVSVESAGLGQGARFTLTLPWVPELLSLAPASADTGGALAQRVSFSALLGRPPVVLTVDDNATTLWVLTSFLEALECQVITAQNGTEALAQTQTAPPDLILLDIHMPDLDGLTVLRRLRAAGSTVPVIALTALAMPEDRERCLAAGADDYLSKPVSLDELTRAITQQLRLKNQ